MLLSPGLVASLLNARHARLAAAIVASLLDAREDCEQLPSVVALGVTVAASLLGAAGEARPLPTNGADCSSFSGS